MGRLTQPRLWGGVLLLGQLLRKGYCVAQAVAVLADGSSVAGVVVVAYRAAADEHKLVVAAEHKQAVAAAEQKKDTAVDCRKAVAAVVVEQSIFHW